MTADHRRYHPYKYTLRTGGETIELVAQPCMRNYKWASDHVINDYRLVQYQNVHPSVEGMLTVWEKRI